MQYIKKHLALITSVAFLGLIAFGAYSAYKSNAQYQQWLDQQRTLQQTHQK